MIKPGYIEITDKVCFIFHELKKPTKEMFKCHSISIQEKAYNYAIKEYEASKRTVEVGNVFWGDLSEEWFFEEQVLEQDIVRNKQKCKAEVNGTAKIIEIL